MLFLEFSNVKLVYGNVILLYGLSVSVVKRDDTKKNDRKKHLETFLLVQYQFDECTKKK